MDWLSVMILNLTTNQIIARQVRLCDTPPARGRGLMFRRPLAEDEALLFVLPSESIADASIHTFFVFFPIAVIWLDQERRVVDVKKIRSFRLRHAPAKPARYVVEGHPRLAGKVQVGHRLSWIESSAEQEDERQRT